MVTVAAVAPGSPADESGFAPGDTVHSVGRRRIRTPLDWEAAMLEVRVGESLSVRVGEDGSRTASLVPTDLPSLTAERVSALEAFELVTLTPAIRAEWELSGERGALIVGVSADVQRTLPLRRGDLIVAINRYVIRSADEAATLLRQLQQIDGRVTVRMIVERQGRQFSTSFYL